jgi:hypothetical protein
MGWRTMYANLNAMEVKKAVQCLNDRFQLPTLNLREIRFDNRSRTLFLRGEPFFRYDQHLHHPTKVAHLYAIYEFLRSIERLFEIAKENS